MRKHIAILQSWRSNQMFFSITHSGCCGGHLDCEERSVSFGQDRPIDEPMIFNAEYDVLNPNISRGTGPRNRGTVFQTSRSTWRYLRKLKPHVLRLSHPSARYKGILSSMYRALPPLKTSSKQLIPKTASHNVASFPPFISDTSFTHR